MTFKLYRIKFLESIFDQHVAVMMIFTGKTIIYTYDITAVLQLMFYLNIRFEMFKYADRGLANDRYYYNIRLFQILFWLGNTVTFLKTKP